MRATSAFVRLFIRGLSWDAAASGASFADTLQEAAQSQVKETARGKVLIRARANGTEAFYSLPPSEGLSAMDIAEVASRVLDKSDELISAASPAGLTDAQLLPALLAAFPPINSSRPDFTGLSRCI